jgi:hypothetical protein
VVREATVHDAHRITAPRAQALVSDLRGSWAPHTHRGSVRHLRRSRLAARRTVVIALKTAGLHQLPDTWNGPSVEGCGLFSAGSCRWLTMFCCVFVWQGQASQVVGAGDVATPATLASQVSRTPHANA